MIRSRLTVLVVTLALLLVAPAAMAGVTKYCDTWYDEYGGKYSYCTTVVSAGKKVKIYRTVWTTPCGKGSYTYWSNGDVERFRSRSTYTCPGKG